MKVIKNLYSGLPREIYILFVSRIINAFGSFVVPLLSLIVIENLNQSESVAGIIVAIAALGYIPGMLIGGHLADYFNRKKVLIYSQILSALLLLSMIFILDTYVKIFILIAAFIVLGASYPAVDALVADLTTEENQKKSYSLLYLGLNIGVAFGPIIGAFLFRHNINYIFIGDAISTLISSILVAVYVKDNYHRESSEKIKSKKATNIQDFISILKFKTLIIFLLLSIFYSFVYSQHNFSLPIYLNDYYGDFGINIFGMLMMTNGIFVILGTPLITKITLKNDSIINMVYSGLCFAIGYGLYNLNFNVVILFVATILWTIGEILISTNFMVYVMKFSNENNRGILSSISNSVFKTGAFLCPLISGKVIEVFGVSQIWTMLFFGMLLVTLCMYVFFIFRQKKYETQIF